MTKNQILALKIASFLWIIWGLVHMLAGVLTIYAVTPNDVGGIADAVDRALLVGEYHPAFGAVLNQHGFNLLWIGAFTVVGGFFIWRQNITAIWTTAVVGFVTDIGYFIFMDLGGFVNFFPGTLMTMISAAAVIVSIPVWFAHRENAAG